jgi:L-2,4-diaminobutyrate transaminase
MPQGDILGFAPPICLTLSEAHEIVGTMNQAVIDVLG